MDGGRIPNRGVGAKTPNGFSVPDVERVDGAIGTAKIDAA
jgi:hypothetical protein